MLKTRVIPCLLYKDNGLVKTIKFKKPNYVGDPINAIKIYNEKEVDELIFLDITTTVEKKEPPFSMINKIASECFMPVCYGGGIRTIEHIRTIFKLGIEKVALNSYAVEHPLFIQQASSIFGSQSIVVSIDVKKNVFKRYEVYTKSGSNNTHLDPCEFALQIEKLGAGEILINSIDRDGTMEGYDIDLLKSITSKVNIPIISCGGAGSIEDFSKAVNDGGASAVAAGSMVVYQGKNRAVLVNFPTADELKKILI